MKKETPKEREYRLMAKFDVLSVKEGETNKAYQALEEELKAILFNPNKVSERRPIKRRMKDLESRGRLLSKQMRKISKELEEFE